MAGVARRLGRPKKESLRELEEDMSPRVHQKKEFRQKKERVGTLRASRGPIDGFKAMGIEMVRVAVNDMRGNGVNGRDAAGWLMGRKSALINTETIAELLDIDSERIAEMSGARSYLENDAARTALRKQEKFAKKTAQGFESV